jgi:hypothetical protein
MSSVVEFALDADGDGESSSDTLPSLLLLWRVDEQLFLRACEQRNLLLLEKMVKNKLVDPSMGDDMALRLACERGQASLLQWLLRDARVTPNDRSFVVACGRGHADVVDLLLRDRRTNMARVSVEAVRVAIDDGHWQIALRILSCGVPVADGAFNAALFAACRASERKALRDRNRPNRHGCRCWRVGRHRQCCR